MTKKELIEVVAIKTFFDKKEIEIVLDAIMQTIKKELVAKNKVCLSPLGIFDIKERKDKICNLENRKGSIIKGAYVPIFKPSKELKEKINK